MKPARNLHSSDPQSAAYSLRHIPTTKDGAPEPVNIKAGCNESFEVQSCTDVNNTNN